MSVDSPEERYVSERLFSERTGNLQTSIEQINEKLDKILDDHEERLRDQQEQIRSARTGILENAGDVEKVCLQIDDHERQTEQLHKDQTLRVAKMALITSMVSVGCVVIFGVLKLANVI